MVIPNERLAAGILRNDTIGSDAIGARRVASGCRPTPTRGRALAALEDETGSEAPSRRSPRGHAGSRSAAIPCRRRRSGPAQAELRAQCLQRLRAEGLLGTGRSRPA